MNLFSSEPYLRTLAETYFPGRRWAIELFQTEGAQHKLLVVDGHGPVTAWPFLDFPQLLDPKEPGRARSLRYLPRAVRETTTAEQRAPIEPGSGVSPAPFIRWAGFADFAAFEAHVLARNKTLPADSRRQRRRIERELGPLRFELDDRGAEAFDTGLRWKSAQYLASGLPDMFANQDHVRMFRALQRIGLVIISSLRAGDRLLAVHLGALESQRMYSWVPSYDVELQRYSPGRLLLESILAESFARRHLEFDFLIGEEAYKWNYATHNRRIGPLGTPPLSLRLEREVRQRVKAALEDHPRLLDLARRVKRLVDER
jgi:CelD/BcsL family acetyltransferase involved in cellulose biosynthesis